MRKRSGFSAIRDILADFDPTEDRFISREFQKYGYDLAEELGDLERKALYMKLAKEVPRHLLESTRNFVKDASGVKSRARLFMWKLAQLRKQWKEKKDAASKR